MKSTVLRYGFYAMLAILVLSAIHFFLVFPNVSYEMAEVVGYLTMVLSMIFVFAGIRHYRDHVNGGTLSFGRGLKIGALIVLIPAVAFGLFDIFYTSILNPSWADEYIIYQIEKIKASAPAGEAEEEIKKFQKNMDTFKNPFFQFLLMAATVYIIGLMVTIISSLALRRNKTVASA